MGFWTEEKCFLTIKLWTFILERTRGGEVASAWRPTVLAFSKKASQRRVMGWGLIELIFIKDSLDDVLWGRDSSN